MNAPRTVFVVSIFIIMVIKGPCRGSSGLVAILSAEAQVEYQTSVCGICGGQSCTGTSFSSVSIFP